MNPPRGHAALEKPAGPIDPEVSVLYVENDKGRPLAALANYSLHYVGHVPEGMISADYFGEFAFQVITTEDFVDFSDLDQIPRPIGVSGFDFPRRLRKKKVNGRIVPLRYQIKNGEVVGAYLKNDWMPEVRSCTGKRSSA